MAVTGNGVSVDVAPAHALRMLLAAPLRVPRADLAQKHYAALPIDLEISVKGVFPGLLRTDAKRTVPEGGCTIGVGHGFDA